MLRTRSARAQLAHNVHIRHKVDGLAIKRWAAAIDASSSKDQKKKPVPPIKAKARKGGLMAVRSLDARSS